MSIEVKKLKDRTEYYKDGLLHRDNDLPAIESPGGTKSWWVNGLELTEEEFDKRYGFGVYDYAMGLL